MFISKIKDNSKCLDLYLYYYLKINKSIFDNYITGMAIPMINKNNYYNVKIPIPSLEKQEEIIKDIQELDLLINDKKKILEKTKFEKEIFLKIINTTINRNAIEIKTLGELFKINGNGKTNSKDISNSGEYPFYSASLNNPSGTHNNYDFNGNDYLLIVKSGGCAKNPISNNYGIGKVFLVNGKCSANLAVYQLLSLTSNNIKYLYYYLLNIKNKIQSLAIYCANNGNIDMEKLKEIKIPIPSIEKQEEIINKIEEFNENHNRFIKELETSIKFNEELKKDLFK